MLWNSYRSVSPMVGLTAAYSEILSELAVASVCAAGHLGNLAEVSSTKEDLCNLADGLTGIDWSNTSQFEISRIGSMGELPRASLLPFEAAIVNIPVLTLQTFRRVGLAS